jgi:hypothetical protein
MAKSIVGLPMAGDLIANADQMRAFLKNAGMSDRVIERAVQARFHAAEAEEAEPPALRRGRKARAPDR